MDGVKSMMVEMWHTPLSFNRETIPEDRLDDEDNDDADEWIDEERILEMVEGVNFSCIIIHHHHAFNVYISPD